MSLITCPECSGSISNKAIICPHCGIPLQDTSIYPIPSRPSRKGRRRRPNGSGTVVKLSGNRKKPYQVRVNTRLDDRGYPVFDVLGNFSDKVLADIALADYNRNPYDINLRDLTFKEVYHKWYVRKFKADPDRKGMKSGSEYNYRAAFKRCCNLHDIRYSDIRTPEMQEILDDPATSHACTEYVSLLLKSMGKYALEFDIVSKDYSQFLQMTKDEDDEPAVPLTHDDIKKLWNHRFDVPFADTILIYCYSGWRITELTSMPMENINLNNRTFFGGMKTDAGKNRIVPIHPIIYDFVKKRYDAGFPSLILHDFNVSITKAKYRVYFEQALKSCGIREKHTPHDCRHTFNSLLDSANVNRVCKLKIMGHAGDGINERLYTHKDIEELRNAVEKVWIP